ncbi:MAG: transcription termination/antitermination protein NusA [Legionellales bacterium]|nr:transcription termination/antitermination protein NusA [Legionellales bacterium]|tara:strand:+ start:417 stop:1967 length:1551 start_codon:yes stop_codon:yes gene_type:complete
MTKAKQEGKEPSPIVFNQQVLVAIEALSAEKKISSDRVFFAIEEAISAVVSKRLEPGAVVRTDINKKDGSYAIYQIYQVTETLPEDPLEAQEYITLEAAQAYNESVNLGDKLEVPLESESLTRIGAHQTKQLLNRIFRQIEREKNLGKLEKKLNQVISVEVIKATRREVLVEIDGAEKGIIRDKDLIPGEVFRTGDRIKAYLYKIDSEQKGHACFLSRTCNEIMIDLFRFEVPEMSDGIITIKSVAREPGIRAKIAVNSVDKRVDAIGATIGMRGARVQEVSKELNGERIDIINWTDKPEEMVEAAMAPATISSIEIDVYNRSMQLAVKEENLSQAIGRSGQNIRLASELTGWALTIMTEEEAEEAIHKAQNQAINLFMEKIDIDEQIAQILVREKITSLKSLANQSQDHLSRIEEFNADIAEEIINRAQLALISDTISHEQTIQELTEKTDDDFLGLEFMTPAIAKKLIEAKISSRDDLAELSTLEIIDITDMPENEAGKLIMSAREHWFKDEGK